MGILEEINAKLDLILARLESKPIQTPEPIIEPIKEPIPPNNSVINITNLWYENKDEIILESGKTYSVDYIKTIPIYTKFVLKSSGKDPANLWVGKENVIPYVGIGDDNYIFQLNNGADVTIENVNVSMRPQSNKVQQRHTIFWFTSVQNPTAKWSATLKDVDTTKLGRNGGLGIGIVYGGIPENKVTVKNYKHAGSMFMELKNPYKEGVMWFVGENITTDYNNPQEWYSASHLTKGYLSKDGILKITGEANATSLYSYFFNKDKGANRSFIAQIDRFVFVIDPLRNQVINDNTIQLLLSPKVDDIVYIKDGKTFFNGREAHPGDSFKINGNTYLIEEKRKTEWEEWTNNWYNGPHPQTAKTPVCIVKGGIKLADGEYIIKEYNSTFDLYDKEVDIYLVNKSDKIFRVFNNTTFGSPDILESRPDHIAYNHSSISIWADNVHLQGYYRESNHGEGKSLGYNIVNSTGFDDEFSQK